MRRRRPLELVGLHREDWRRDLEIAGDRFVIVDKPIPAAEILYDGGVGHDARAAKMVAGFDLPGHKVSYVENAVGLS